MQGLMCNSTAICMSHELRSTVVPNNYVRLRDHGPIIPPVFLSSSSIKHQHSFQVVVMRVSIHCQGCAAKLNKHLSKMHGVTSFSIDLESKRVTVKGHVSPSGVVESISKVKKAELWPS
ncbi:Heavy metal transport/detoxification superfamily protein [Perilla frutescens var. frutescens]|nr:Heavy metal transport/detoxification superfamily protein [Perilla frutescens var. frutescens]